MRAAKHPRTIVKWKNIPYRPSISHRLKNIRDLRPLNVAPLLSYGWTSNDRLRLEIGFVYGKSWKSAFGLFTPDFKIAVINKAFQTLKSWPDYEFIHGDLSLTNILIAPQRQSSGQPDVWFVDWTLDLNSYEGTPKFAAPEVYKGRRGYFSDHFALNQIVKIAQTESSSYRIA